VLAEIFMLRIEAEARAARDADARWAVDADQAGAVASRREAQVDQVRRP
jgi:hypothetical protein